MAEASNKRKATSHDSSGASKKQKNWQTPKQAYWSKAGKEIHIGDVGIWVTCDRNREGKCAAEVMDLFEEYAQKLYGTSSVITEGGEQDDAEENEPSDIEEAISSELSNMKKAKSKSLFTVVRPEIACVIFIKTKLPVDPVKLVHSICKNAAVGGMTKRYWSVKRLTPATLTEKAHERNFEDLARQILKPVFHEDDSGSKKFAIRYSSRNNTTLSRDGVIKKTAELVGNAHKVDLGNPDVTVLIEIYKNICTMAIVDGDYNDLKRYNLSELGANQETSSKTKSSIAPRSATERNGGPESNDSVVIESNAVSAEGE